MYRTHGLPGILAGLALVVAGCGGGGADGGAGTAAQPRYVLVADHRQLMINVLEPAADVIWDSAGFVITADGEEDLSPNDAAGWAQVRGSALRLAESANLLMLPGRTAGADWDEYALGLSRTAQSALAAARQQDADALFDAGGQIYQVCRACHQQYWIRADRAAAQAATEPVVDQLGQ